MGSASSFQPPASSLELPRNPSSRRSSYRGSITMLPERVRSRTVGASAGGADDFDRIDRSERTLPCELSASMKNTLSMSTVSRIEPLHTSMLNDARTGPS